MANENEFVQEVRFAVHDGELTSAINKMQQTLEGINKKSLGKDMKDGFKKAGDEAKKTAAETEKIAKASKHANEETKKLSSTFDRLKGAIGGAIAAYAGFQGVSKLVGFGKGSIAAFTTQRKNELMLDTVLKNSGLQDSSRFLKMTAANIQGKTTIGDESMIAGAAELSTYVKNPMQMKRMMELLADYSMGMTGGAELSPEAMTNLATGLGKAFDGSYESLRKKGFDTSELEALKEREKKGEVITEDMKVTALENALKDWKGLAEEFANTDEGKIQQLKNDIGDMREEIGRELLPIVGSLAARMRENLPTLRKLFEAFKNVIISLMDVLKNNESLIVGAVNKISQLLNLFAQAPVATTAFAASLKYLVPMLTQVQGNVISMSGAFAGLGGTLTSILKGGLITAAIWGLGQIFKFISTSIDLLHEKSNEAKRAEWSKKFNEAVDERTQAKKDLDSAKADMDKYSGNKATREYQMAYGRYMNAQTRYSNAQSKINYAQSTEGRKLYGFDMSTPDAPSFTEFNYDYEAEMKKAMAAAAKATKGDTHINNINYTNEITTDSDLMAKMIKENLRTLLTSQLTIVNRNQAVKAMSL